MRRLAKKWVAAIASIAGCATGTSFHVAAPDAAWQRIAVAADRVAYHRADGGTIQAAESCTDGDDVPLDVLINHLLIGIDARRELSRQPLILDGRAALRARVDGTLDGVPVALDLVVLRKNGCTYDLSLVDRPSRIALNARDFDRFLATFSVRR